MFRRALLYILILATISMACFVTFVHAQGVCAELYVETAAPEGEEILQFVGMPQGSAAMVGQYSEGTDAGDIFIRIYGPGNREAFVNRHFGIDGASVTLQQVVPSGKEIHLICLVTPRAQDTVSYGAVYVLDQNGEMQEPVFYKETEGEAQYGFNRFVCADSYGRAYAGIQNQRVTVFNEQGEVILQLNSEQTREIYDVRYGDDGVLIAGCTTESGKKETVHRGFCSFYDLEGNRVWRKAVAGEEGVKASIVQILDDRDGWILYGRYGIDDFAQLETQGIRFRFEAGQVKGNHTFLIGIDQEGQVTKQVTYAETSPYLVSQSLSVESGLLLRDYTAKRAGADRYVVETVRLDHNLEEISRGEIPVWGDQTFYCAPWAENAQDGIWIYYAGKIQFFKNEQAIHRHFTGLMKWRPVCTAALSMRAGAPWFLCLYGMMTLCTLGIARSPHSRHYGAFSRKKRHV